MLGFQAASESQWTSSMVTANAAWRPMQRACTGWPSALCASGCCGAAHQLRQARHEGLGAADPRQPEGRARLAPWPSRRSTSPCPRCWRTLPARPAMQAEPSAFRRPWPERRARRALALARAPSEGVTLDQTVLPQAFAKGDRVKVLVPFTTHDVARRGPGASGSPRQEPWLAGGRAVARRAGAEARRGPGGRGSPWQVPWLTRA